MSNLARCVFVSSSGEMRDRWHEAFPGARSARIDQMPADAADLYWLLAKAGEFPRTFVGKLPDSALLVVISDEPSDEAALQSFAFGARGYCNANVVPELLQRIASVVLSGGMWIGESLMQQMLIGLRGIPSAQPGGAVVASLGILTEREKQVAQAVSEGASNKEIARQLGITERTVKAHTGAIFEKLGVRDRLQLSLLLHGHQIP